MAKFSDVTAYQINLVLNSLAGKSSIQNCHPPPATRHPIMPTHVHVSNAASQAGHQASTSIKGTQDYC